MRIGHGYDAHRFEEGRKLILGGIDIPYHLGLKGHSDADVVTHSLIDSFLGACCMGDIGMLFPDSCEKYNGICSVKLLEQVFSIITHNGYEICNIDITLICQEPKMQPYISLIREKLSKVLFIDLNQINIKATTEEKMGFTGRLEGISCHCVSLLKNKF